MKIMDYNIKIFDIVKLDKISKDIKEEFYRCMTFENVKHPWYTLLLIKLIMKADYKNKYLLRMSYPEYVYLVTCHQEIPGWWEKFVEYMKEINN